MKLTITMQVAVDGVIQGNGGLHDVDRKRGFERGGWAMPLFDEAAMASMNEIYERADAFLFGRRTFDVFAESWGENPVMRAQPIGVALNERPKYLVSSTLTEPRWANTTVLSGDLAAAISELKAKPGGELQVHGCGELSRWLLKHDLVDEMNLFVCPVIVGQGTRMFPDGGPDLALELVDSLAFPKGITLQIYRPAGRPQYANRPA